MAPINLTGTWLLEKSENLNKFLLEMGVDAVGGNFRTVLTITQTDDHIHILASNPLGDTQEEFTVGQEFKTSIRNTAIRGRCLASWEGNVLVCEVTFSDPDRKPQRVTRELTSPTEQICTIYVGDVVCRRYYRKQ